MCWIMCQLDSAWPCIFVVVLGTEGTCARLGAGDPYRVHVFTGPTGVVLGD